MGCRYNSKLILVGLFNTNINLSIIVSNDREYQNISTQSFETGEQFILNCNINVLEPMN